MRLRVATLNVWALPGPFAEDVASRMKAIGQRLRTLDVDLIAFQEVWTSSARAVLIAAGERIGFKHASPEIHSWGGSGLLTLSRLPMEYLRFERFQVRGRPEHANGEYLSGKGFMVVELKTPEGPITLVNTHLHARYERAVGHRYLPHRTAQMIQLAAWVAKASGPVVVLGDFNFGEGQPEHTVFTALTDLRDVAAELDRRRPTVDRSLYYRRNSSKPERRHDMVFVRDGASTGLRTRSLTRLLDERIDFDGRPGGYSNHAALRAELEISPSLFAAPRQSIRGVVEMASRLLAQGREDACQRQSDARALSSAGIACGLVAGVSLRGRKLSRRRLLRNSLRAAALVALAPAVGLPIFTEVVVPDEIEAFDEAAAQLASLEARHEASVQS